MSRFGLSRVRDLACSEGLRGHLLRGATGTVALKVANAFLGLGVAIVLARSLGPEGYGIYAFAFSVATILSVPAQFGIPQLVVREVAKNHLHKEWGLLKGSLRRANRGVIAISVPLLAIGWLSIALLVGDEVSSLQRQTVYAALLLIPFIALASVCSGALRGLRCVVRGQLTELVLRPGLLITLLVAVGLYHSLTPALTMELHVVAAAISFVVGVLLLNGALPREVKTAAPEYQGGWLASVLPFGLLAGLQVINAQTDIFMLGVLGTGEEVGLYRVAVQGGALAAFSLSSVNAVIAPHITRLYYEGDQSRLQRMVTLSARATLLAAVPVASVLIVFGHSIIRLAFGESYVGAYMALATLSAAQLLNAAAGSVGLLMNMTGNEHVTIRITGLVVVLNVLLNGLLIPQFGIEGAAAATAVSLVAWNVLLARSVWKRIRLLPTAFGIAMLR